MTADRIEASNMAHPVSIGDDRREAIDWLQDWLATTRPIAERTMISLLRDGIAITTDGGIMLTEDEDDVKRKSRSRARSHGKSGNAKPARSGGRHGRTVVKYNQNFSSAAQDMLLAEQDIKRTGKDDADALP